MMEGCERRGGCSYGAGWDVDASCPGVEAGTGAGVAAVVPGPELLISNPAAGIALPPFTAFSSWVICSITPCEMSILNVSALLLILLIINTAHTPNIVTKAMPTMMSAMVQGGRVVLWY